MRIAVVVHRYGTDLAGGGEQLARGFAEAAVRRGWTIEVWTTCALSHYTWENVYPAGKEIVNDVVVRRFPITSWSHDQRAALEFRLHILGTLPLADQYAWLETGAHSAPLYRHIVNHANEFDALMVLPYAMPLAQYAAWSALERTVLWLCLHDEPYAYLEVSCLLMESVRSVVFNSPEERELALQVLGIQPRQHALLGVGVELTPCANSPQADSHNALLYVGRLEHGKNAHLLYQYVQRYFDAGGRIRLVVMGDGPVKPPAHPAFDYRGLVSEQEKATACASALALCQPSINESFSLTIMESWMNGRPVLVNGECAVTRGHVRRCDGGLEFRDYDEFVGAVEWFQDHPELANQMGKNGREYVQRNYKWQVALDRFERMMGMSPNPAGTVEDAQM